MKYTFIGLIIFCLIFVSTTLGQSCSDQDFVLEKGGSVLLTLGPNGGSIPGKLVVGADVSALQENDTLVVNGGIRFIGGSSTRPACQFLTSGLFYYADGRNGKGDGLFFCSQVQGTGNEFNWRQLQLAPVGVSGPAIRDFFGNYWDGYMRNPATFAVASSTCAALGARLPTISDVTRTVNLFAAPVAGDPSIWTSTIAASAGAVLAYRQSDLVATPTAVGGSLFYRCVWPSAGANYFGGSNCYNTLTNDLGCFNYSLYNVDRGARVALTYAQASYECNSKGGSLPNFGDLYGFLGSSVGDYPIQGGPPVFSNTVSFSTAFTYLSSLLSVNPRFTQFASATAIGSTAPANYVCIGRKSNVPLYPPNPNCNGGTCFVIVPTTKSPIFADTLNRPALPFVNASIDCALSGGRLPDLGNVADLVHQGWVGNASSPIWTSSPSRISGATVNYVGAVVTAGIYWDPTVHVAEYAPSTALQYRCVFPVTFTPSSPFTNCAKKALLLDPNVFTVSCLNTSPGPSAGRQIGTENIDDFGYSWDAFTRGSRTWQDAFDTCNSLGGRLPTLGEFYQYAIIFQNKMPGDNSFTAYWTALTDGQTRGAFISKNGDADNGLLTDLHDTRCVWPPTPYGNIFGGMKCHGGCFEFGNLVIDNYDRPLASVADASQECQLVGGRLPTFDELTFLIRNGAPNGYYPCSSLSTTITIGCPRADGVWTVSSGGSQNTYWAVRWLGVDRFWTPNFATSWTTSSNIRDVSTQTEKNRFRCVFSTNV